MLAILDEIKTVCDIELSPAWLGYVSGLKAEKMLRNRHKPYLYVLRAGEYEMEYYVTFIDVDLSIRHQPFVITSCPEGWYCENGGGIGPYKDDTIDEIIHHVIHCKQGEASPLNPTSPLHPC
jgi:hypothetical protein